MSVEGGSGRKSPSAAGGNGAAGKRREPLSSHGPGAAAERHAVVAIDVSIQYSVIIVRGNGVIHRGQKPASRG